MPTLDATVTSLIALIDETINRQLNKIMHHQVFQKLEASWRGLKMLVNISANDARVQIRALNLSQAEMIKDLESAIEFDQSQLFKKVYSAEFDQPGGQPYGLLVGNYEFMHRTDKVHGDSVSILRELAKIAAASFAPFIGGASPGLFGLDRFSEMQPTLSFEQIFKQTEYQRWQSLRDSDDMRFIGLAMPHILMREPYNQHGQRKNHRFFYEAIKSADDFLWGNACFAYASVAIQAFMHSGWFGDIRGVHPETLTGGLVKGIKRHYFNTDQAPKCVTEVQITDTQEKRLSDIGLLALRDHPLANMAVFYSSQSLQKAKGYDRASADTNSKISSMLHYLMCVARFAHYVKVMMRDKVGSFVNASECQEFLQQWLLSYCAATQDLKTNSKARFPLNSAKVEVSEQPGLAGQYQCVMHIKPHYQLDNIQSHLRLVTQLPAG